MPAQLPDEPDEFHELVEAIRRFNRLYTSRIGLLAEGHLDSPYSLTEARILFELNRAPPLTAAALCQALGLDQGYVSRILTRFAKHRLIRRRASVGDGRARDIALTVAGRKAAVTLDRRSHGAIAALLKTKTAAAQREIGRAARTLEELLGAPPPSPLLIRPPKPGDLGWIVHRQAVLYSREYGWTIEGIVAEIVAPFAKQHDPARERCWIAERDGDILGAVFVMKDDDETARLRLLYVEAAARGSGLGRRLVELCVAFAREAGYRRVKLWTHTVLTAARKIYQGVGFRLVEEYSHSEFGVEVHSETWELDLKDR